MEHDTGLPSGGHGPEDRPDVIGNGPVEPTPRGRRTATVATAAVLLVAAGGAAAWAAGTAPGGSAEAVRPLAQAAPEGSASPTPAPSAGSQEGQGRGLGHGPGGLKGGRGLLGALHGDLTVPDGEGTKQVRVQRGAVTAVSPTSVTVKSTDGYSSTYAVGASTRVDGTAGSTASLAVGDQVVVLADLDGSAATAREVHERRAPAAGEDGTTPPGRAHAPGQRRHDGGAAPAPGGTAPDGTAPGGAAPAPASPVPSGPGGEGSSSRLPAAPGADGLPA